MAFKVISDNGLETDEDDVTIVVAAANAYVSVEDMLAYWLDRGIDLSDYDAEAVQANIIKATDYIERRFGPVWRGVRSLTGQCLSWPRTGVRTRDGVDVTTVPKQVRHACAEYAYRSLLGTSLWSDPTLNRNVKRKVTAVGPIREEVEYVGGGLATEDFPLADALLADFIYPRGTVTR